MIDEKVLCAYALELPNGSTCMLLFKTKQEAAAYKKEHQFKWSLGFEGYGEKQKLKWKIIKVVVTKENW